jgi:hypothetical protein
MRHQMLTWNLPEFTGSGGLARVRYTIREVLLPQ